MAKSRKNSGGDPRKHDDITPGRLPPQERSRPRDPTIGSSQDRTASLGDMTLGRPPLRFYERPPSLPEQQATHRPVGRGDLTVLYIHGIANKPIASTLKCQWDTALFEARLGQRSRMAYWVNRQRYPIPLNTTCRDSDFSDESFDSPEMNVAIEAVDEEPLRSLPESARPHRAALQRIADRMLAETEPAAGEPYEERYGYGAELLPLPRPMRRWVTRRITRAFLPDVHDYLFEPEQRRRIDDAVRQRLVAGGRFVILGHSLGSVVAYHVLASLQRERAAPDVPLLITLGSPLAMAEVQDGLRDLLGEDLPALSGVGDWMNLSDRLDPVAAVASLAADYRCAGEVVDIGGFGVNADGPRHPHSATGYLVHPQVRAKVRRLVGSEFSEQVTNFTIARDVADWVEDAALVDLKEVLIEFKPTKEGHVGPSRESLIAELKVMLGDEFENRCVCLQRYLAVRLTSTEIEILGSRLKADRWGRIWQDAEKSALVVRSAATVHAPTAWRGYDALGQRIQWAVLDTGIRPDHPHFAQWENVAAVWDCTVHAPDPIGNNDQDPRGPGIDRQGHGTHVAGVIAGRFPGPGRLAGDDEPSGMAPMTKLHSYKVLDDDGRGRDSWIIKALQHIEELNRSAGDLVIQGVNLSLGGDFDPEVYACGHSPLCNELRRLWRQGVVIVTSAGNLGSLTVEAGSRRVRLNLDLSIGDPANLDEAISVGSVHKSDARLYGVSYFSSRGPTADGRFKPDLVAPGERIVSARADFRVDVAPDLHRLDSHYVELSGTSMAAPHVSGLLAAFLSQRRSFIGRPQELREVLVEHCTDIGRDRYHQGAGVPNLIKMLLSASS